MEIAEKDEKLAAHGKVSKFQTELKMALIRKVTMRPDFGIIGAYGFAIAAGWASLSCGLNRILRLGVVSVAGSMLGWCPVVGKIGSTGQRSSL